MVISDDQHRANRQNAQNSTGPKTKQGKTASSKNAVTHGLYSEDIILDCPSLREDPVEYEALLESIWDDFLPVGQFEEELVEKIAICLWRSRRAIRAETAFIRDQLSNCTPVDESQPFDDTAASRLNHINQRSIPRESISAYIQRYEMRLDRQLCRAYSLLVCLQNRRKDDTIEAIKNRDFSKCENEAKPFVPRRSTPIFVSSRPLTEPSPRARSGPNADSIPGF